MKINVIRKYEKSIGKIIHLTDHRSSDGDFDSVSCWISATIGALLFSGLWLMSLFTN